MDPLLRSLIAKPVSLSSLAAIYLKEQKAAISRHMPHTHLITKPVMLESKAKQVDGGHRNLG